MRVLTILILVALVLASGALAFAQDGDINESLLLNDLSGNGGICKRQEALAFFASLDGLEQIMNSVVDIADQQSLLDWLNKYDEWILADEQLESYDPLCYGVLVRGLEMDRNVKYAVLLYLTEGEAAFHEQAALVSAREIAGGDLATIIADALPDVELEINRAFAEHPLCTNKRAIAFLETLEAYAFETGRAAEINDNDSLNEWASRFDAWRLEAWSSFYDQPCGITEIVINIYETVSFSFALLRLTRIGDIYVSAIDAFLEEVLDLVESDMSAINGLQGN